MKAKTIRYGFAAAGVVLGLAVVNDAFAHKARHTPEQLKAFEDVFMEQVRIGDLLFHGDEATMKQLNVQLSNTSDRKSVV